MRRILILMLMVMLSALSAQAQFFGGKSTNNYFSDTNLFLTIPRSINATFPQGTNAPVELVRGSTFRAWLEGYFATFSMINASNYVPATRTLTIAGTANEITSSAGAQDLSANRTWTLSLASGINPTKLADGSVTASEFQFIGGLTSDAQAQIDGKQPIDSDLTSIAGLADPNAHRVLVWDDTDNAYRHAVIGAGLAYDQPTKTLSATGGGAGEANTLSSLGDGWPLAAGKSGVDLRINSVTNADTSIITTSNANRILFSRAALTGDVTAPAGGNATTIANDAVSNAKLANMAQNTIKLRVSSGSSDPEDGTPAQALTVLESGGTDIVTATEGNANYVLQANGNSSGHNALGALRTSGPRIDWPGKTPSGTLTVTATNLWTLETNASFALTLSGTATNGQLMTFYVKNTHATSDITMTNAQTFDVPELGAVTNLINIKSNSLSIFGMRYLTNFVAGGQWYLEQWQGFLYSIKPGANITFTTNADGTITIAASAGAAGDSVTVDGAATTDPNFDDGGDINFTHSGGNITAAVKADSVALGTDTTGNYAAGDAEAGAALTGDSATSFFGTGTLEDARLPATMAGKNFTTSTATTPGAGDNDTSLATSQFVQSAINAPVYSILTNSYAGFNVFWNFATNTMQMLIATNNFALIPTNMAAGQRLSLTIFNITGTNIFFTNQTGVRIFGSGVSNQVAAGKFTEVAAKSITGSITNVSMAFAVQKN